MPNRLGSTFRGGVHSASAATVDNKLPPHLLPGFPSYVRLPPAGRSCPISGLPRTTLAELILPTARNGWRPPVRSVTVHLPGREHLPRTGRGRHGIRLVEVASLLAWIRSFDSPRDPLADLPVLHPRRSFALPFGG